MNKSTFIRPGGGDKDRSLTKVHNKPDVSMQYIHDMVASQKGEKPSRAVTEAEEETMFNRIWNQDIRR
jgi:hypothetical protein